MPTTATETTIGENIKLEETDDEIVIHINKKYRGSKSASGKTILVASTKGNKQLNDGIYLGLNAYIYPEK